MTERQSIKGAERGAAAAEMALVLPVLLTLVAGLFEMGNYFYSEHRLVESVRDAARYASRHGQNNFQSCTSLTSGNTIYDNARLLASKGTLDSNDSNLLWGWGKAGETFTLTINCAATADDGDPGTTDQVMGGIYRDSAVGAQLVTIAASLEHPTVFAYVGLPLTFTLNASSQATVAGV